MANLKEKLIELLKAIGVSNSDTAAYYLVLNNLNFAVPCEKCAHLRKCRACCRCNHPNGLKEPKPDQGTFCCYGVERNPEDEVPTDECETN